jgi:putative ABC transport system substrate-binding protein
MRRRDFLSVIVGATAWPLAAGAQQPAMPVVGFLTFEMPGVPTSQHLGDAFRLGLAEAGYVEGKTARIEADGARRRRAERVECGVDPAVRRRSNSVR